MEHTTQLSRLRSRLRRHAGKYDLFPLIVADLSEENLERAPLILTSRPNVAAVNGECNRFRHHPWPGSRPRDSLLLQPRANTKGSLPGGFHGLWLAERQKLRQQRPRPAVGNSEPIFATIRSYSGVHRSGMISVIGLSVRRQVTAHRHGVKRGARTSTVPNNDTNRRER
jgi:hypothetical protein